MSDVRLSGRISILPDLRVTRFRLSWIVQPRRWSNLGYIAGGRLLSETHPTDTGMTRVRTQNLDVCNVFATHLQRIAI